ncbi:MAG: alpha/beta hydrolase [Acidimicrobiia bacterium]|nr:alpha/beta hydrolase [Acidimicrobiia bacterium]
MSHLVFVHGAGLSGASWRPQTSFFAESVAVDLPGHGKSTGEAHDSVPAYAGWLERHMRSLSPGPVTLVGHSLGSLIVLETAARNPDFVDRLVLIATAATMPVNRDLLAKAKEKDAAAAAMVIKWSLREPGYGRPKPWVVEISNAYTTAAENGVLARDLTACDTYAGATAAASTVRCPTLLILGERDVMTKPAAAQPLAAALEDARIVMMEGAGHMLPLENANDVNDAITLFLATD